MTLKAWARRRARTEPVLLRTGARFALVVVVMVTGLYASPRSLVDQRHRDDATALTANLRPKLWALKGLNLRLPPCEGE
jgi:hypothetical protein